MIPDERDRLNLLRRLLGTPEDLRRDLLQVLRRSLAAQRQERPRAARCFGQGSSMPRWTQSPVRGARLGGRILDSVNRPTLTNAQPRSTRTWRVNRT
jgi:hypothetical protein